MLSVKKLKQLALHEFYDLTDYINMGGMFVYRNYLMKARNEYLRWNVNVTIATKKDSKRNMFGIFENMRGF